MEEANKDYFEKLQYEDIVGKLVDDMTLMDDELMSMAFDGNIPATELLLRTILEDDGIEVVSVTGQKVFKNPLAEGRDIKLDILARDRYGRHHNVEVQRDSGGASERRARFHSSMLDSRMLKKGQKFKQLRDSYVIFITERDYFGYGLPVYIINRYIEKVKRKFSDGSHIIYVNGSYRGDDSLGRLMRDFACKDARDMYYPELADSVRHFKEEGGRDGMSRAVEEYAEMRAREAAARAKKEAAEEAAVNAKKEAEEAAVKSTIEDAVSYGMSKTQIITKVCDKYKVGRSEALELYDRFSGLPTDVA